MRIGSGVGIDGSGVNVGVGIREDNDVFGDVEESFGGERTEDDSTAVIASRSVVLAK